jgi:two-component system, OmpR family, sensor histidine kinase ChvG
VSTRGQGDNFSASLTGKLAVLIAIFITVPIVLYTQFRAADQDKQKLLLAGVDEQARLITEAVRPTLEKGTQRLPTGLTDVIRNLATDGTSVKILFRPEDGHNPDSFFYIASAPEVPVDLLQGERDRLIELGVLDKLAETCAGDLPVAKSYVNSAGQEQVITSVNPVLTDGGCWAVVMAHSTTAYQKLELGRPYWETPEVRFSALIYGVMAFLVFTMFYGAWRGFQQFADLARSIRIGGGSGRTFAAKGNVLEVAGLAEQLDRLVGALEGSSRSIRQAAEENAHAFKTPVAVIRQSIEPLKRQIDATDERGARALEIIEKSTDRLDYLISSAWRMDEIAADLVDPPRNRVEFSVLLTRMMGGYGDLFRSHKIAASVNADNNVVVRAGEDLLETVIENLVENAVTFSPPGGSISIGLHVLKSHAVLTVEDQGPGVPSEDLERIFERYYSHRPADQQNDDPNGGRQPRHFGIGLWIVRRNMEAIGGTAIAENTGDGGLKVTARLPVAR